MIFVKYILISGLFLFSANALAADFNRSILNVLKHEGFLVNDKADPGGITNYGVSARYLNQLVRKSPEVQALIDIDGIPGVTRGDIENMRIEDAIHIYRFYWWEAYGYGKIKSQILADKIFDMSVNMGSVESHTLVARAYQIIKHRPMKDFMDINKLSHIECQRLLIQIRQEQMHFYQTLAVRHPKSKKFLPGWLKRAAQ